MDEGANFLFFSFLFHCSKFQPVFVSKPLFVLLILYMLLTPCFLAIIFISDPQAYLLFFKDNYRDIVQI